jgi:hypothetical protein
VQEGKADVNLSDALNSTPLLESLLTDADKLAIPRYLLAAGGRVLSLDSPAFNSRGSAVTKAWLQEEVKKLEVH